MNLCCITGKIPWTFIVSMVVLRVLYKFSPAVRFYVNSALLYLFFLINSTISCPYGLYYFKQYRKTTLFNCKLVYYFCKFMGIEWTIEKEAEVDTDKSYIILCNHQSSVDMLAMMTIWPHLGHTVAIAKKELKYLGPFGLNLYLCGAIFVDRISGEKSHKAINEASSKAKAEGTSIWIYPEGTRNRKRDGTLLPFKKGAFHMAIDNKMPILPVVISEYEFMDPKLKRFEPGKATIKVLKPIDTDKFTKENLQELIDETRDKMCQELKNLSSKKHN